MGYPLFSELDNRFIRSLTLPDARKDDYGNLFALSQGNVKQYWEIICKAVESKDKEALAAIGDWNLDTGMDVGNKKMVFWG